MPGCIARGIPEHTASRIYDDMMDFAKYAFNKSHAACYAVVSYQTAWLKYYYPLEFMAALLTSVIDNPRKVSEYILACRSMGISILQPDINFGEANFSVSDGAIRYALTAIKSIGKGVIEFIVGERQKHGPYKNLKDFITRASGSDLNKRGIENLIKAGAFDGLGGTRKQLMSIYVQVLESIQQDKKNNMAGQLTLFDLVGEEDRKAYDIHLPDVGEYSREMMLTFEKEVLGIYVSGHPLEEYEAIWKKHITATTADFLMDEETGAVQIENGSTATVGGIIADKKIKYTKNDKVMAFLQLEDLAGSIEVIVFPRDYERYSSRLTVDNKVFIRGRVSVDEEKDGKLICEELTAFEDIPRMLWIKFPTLQEYEAGEAHMYDILRQSDGKDRVTIYIEQPKSMKKLPANMSIQADEILRRQLAQAFGDENVKVV